MACVCVSLCELWVIVGMSVCYQPSSIYHQLFIFAYQVSYRHKDTWTLQIDKCVLTTLREISTWSPGSLPGTHFYLHLLRLAEETLNLLHDLWLQLQNPSLCSVLFSRPSLFFLSVLLLPFRLILSTLPSLPGCLASALVLQSVCHCERPLQECYTCGVMQQTALSAER